MIPLRLEGVASVLLLSAHPDDVEIGAGGLLLTLAAAGRDLRVHDVVCTGSPERRAEAERAAAAFLPGAQLTFAFHDLPDGRMPAQWAAAKQLVHDAAKLIDPDVVLAPRCDDAHQDHRLLGELATQAFRDHLVLHYEIPKWDGDMGRPNAYVPIEDDVARRKVALLDDSFVSQRHHDWWDGELFLGLMRMRGMECRARYAEAFECRKARLVL